MRIFWLIVLGVLLAGEGVAAEVDSVRVDSLCQAGRDSLAGENLEGAEFLFKQVLETSPESLEALRGLGEVAFRQEKWGDVKEMYGKVLAQVPEDAEALYRRATGFRETGKVKATGPRWLDWRASEQLFEKLVEKWPEYGDGYVQYAELERYRGEYRKAIGLGEMQVAVRPGWAHGEFRLFRLYRHLLDNRDPVEEAGWLREQASEFAQYFVGEALRFGGRLAEADSALQGWLETGPLIRTVPVHLSLVRLYYEQDAPEKAEGVFWEAVEGIRDSLDAALVFEDMKYVVDRAEMAAFDSLSTLEAYRAFFRRFWVRRDPMPAGVVNVRMEEHYRRLMYAEKYYVYDGFRTWFFDPEKEDHVDYPETSKVNDRFNDMGLVYIRHGDPWNREKGTTMKESWWYKEVGSLPEMVFHFEATPSAEGSNWRLVESLYGSTHPMRVRWEVEKQIRKSRMSVQEGFTTDRHTWDGNVKLVEPDVYVAFFRGEEGGPVGELYYGFPVKRLGRKFEEVPDTAGVYEYGLAVYDSVWERVDRVVSEISRKDFIQVKERGVGSVSFQVSPDSVQMSFFVRPFAESFLGIWKGQERVPELSGTNLFLSSIVPAFSIGSEEDEVSSRGVSMSPNPSLRFRRKEPVYAYFEVYNLTPDEGGRTAYRVEYTVAQKERSGVGKLLSVFGARDKPATAVSLERRGESPGVKEFVSLDLSRAGRGKFLLKVRVIDEYADVEVERTVGLELH